MNDEITFLSALLVGLLSGGTHCPAMCGGIVSALSLGLRNQVSGKNFSALPFVLAYNFGRISSYIVAGLIAGALGSWLSEHLFEVHRARLVLQVLAGIFMILLGFYISSWWRFLSHIEAIGVHVWKYVEPLGRRFLPVQSVPQAFMLGIFWGWLPCGLVYTALIWSLSSGGMLQGGYLMLGFGLGTMPLMIAMGLGVAGISSWIQKAWFRSLSGLLVMAFGVYLLWQVSAAWNQ